MEITPPHVQLAIMSREYVVSRAIHAIANLGIADHMSDKPMSIEELAKLTGTIPDLLDRVLNFLSLYGLFIKTGDAYALTPLSYPLKQDNPNSIKDILGMFDESWWQAFAHLETGLKTGIPAFQHQHGTDFFDFMNENADKKANFEKGQAKLSAFDDKTIAKAFNFGQYQSLINIGEKKESLSRAIKSKYSDLSITPYPFNPKTALHSQADLFTHLPPADAYLFKGILHDFSDYILKKILNACHQSMRENASLIIAEQVIPDHDLPHTNKTMDIIMMVLVGGKQRTLSNWRNLLVSVGFKLQTTAQTQGVFMVMEYVK